jgi:hypothetical protein
MPQYKEASDKLENNDGAAWKLIFKLLARGSLYDNNREMQLKVTAGSLLRESADDLFVDI